MVASTTAPCVPQRGRPCPKRYGSRDCGRTALHLDKGHGDKERNIMADNEEDERVEAPPAEEEEPTNQDDNGPQPDSPTQEEESDKTEDDDIDKRVRSLEQDIREIRAMIDALGIDDGDTATAEDTATDGDVDDDGEPDPTDITLEDILERK